MALRPFWAWLRAGAARQGLSTAAWDAGNLDLSNRGLVNELLTQCRTLHSSPALGMRNKTAQKGGGDEWGWNPLLRPEESTALGADEIRWALERAEELAKEEREAIRQTGSDERVRAANAGNAKGAAVVGGSNVAKHEVVQTARTGAPGAMKSEAHLGEEGKQKGTQFAAKVGGQKSRGATELKRGADVQFKPVKVVKSQPRFDKAKAGAEKPRGDFVRRPEGQLGSGTQPRRLGFGVHKEAPWSGRFQVRQGAALTGDLWNEVAPDAEESFRQSAAELDTAVGVQKSSESVRSTMDDVQKGRRGGGVEEGTEVDSRGVGGVVPKQDLDRGGRLEGHSGEPSTFERVLDVFDGEETVLAGELSGVRLEDDARLTESGGRVTTATGTSHWGVKSKQPIQPVSMPVNLSNSQQESTSSPYNGAATKRRSSADMTEEMGAPFLESVPTSYMATQLESDRLSQRKEGTERLSEESDGSDRFSDGLDGSNRVPDLEELRTWLSQLDRQGEGELEEEENEERRESASVPVEKQKSLRLAIMGPPNAGKSVLTNALVGAKVSAVSAKTNTTRAPIIGVSTHRSTQLVVCDTPGLASLAPGRELRSTNQQLVNRAQRAGADCDVVIVVIDAAREIERPDPRIPRMIAKLGEQLPDGQKHALVLNKVDAIEHADRPKLEELRERLMMLHAFDRCFVTSGKRELGLKQLYRYLRKNAVLRPWELPEGRPTDLSDEQRAMDIVRQHLLDRLHKEVPYKVVVKPVGWNESGNGVLEIRQDLIVDRKKIKAMVVGKKGATIKQITLGAREELGKIFGRQIELFLNIRVEGT